MNATEVVPPLKRTRIVLSDGTAYRPVCAVHEAPGPHGGLILDLSGYAQISTWSYGVSRLPPGSGAAVASLVGPHAVRGVRGRPPKLHYHRDGYVSVDQTRRLPKRAIRAERLDELHDGDCFKIVLRHPARWRDGSRRKTDSILEVQGPWPASVKIVGRVGQAEDLQAEHRVSPVNPRQYPMIGEDGVRFPMVLALLSSHGLTCYVRLSLHANSPEFDASPTAAAALLMAHSHRQAADPSELAELLTVLGEEGSSEMAERAATARVPL